MSELKTAVVKNKFNGKEMFTVYDVEHIELAEQLGKNINEMKAFKPIINIGMKKAKALFNHSDALADFVNE